MFDGVPARLKQSPNMIIKCKIVLNVTTHFECFATFINKNYDTKVCSSRI